MITYYILYYNENKMCMIKSESLEYKFEANLLVVRIDRGSFSWYIPIYIYIFVDSQTKIILNK